MRNLKSGMRVYRTLMSLCCFNNIKKQINLNSQQPFFSHSGIRVCDEIKWFSCKTRQEFNEHSKKEKKVRDKLLVEKIKKKAKFFDNYEKTSSLDISQLFNLLCANIAHLIALMMNARKFFMSHINIQCKIIHKHFSFQQLLAREKRKFLYANTTTMRLFLR